MVREEENISSVEIWGGSEYSVVRVKNTVYDQLACNNHEIRINDLDLFREAGIKKVRYPLLWERYVNNEEEFFRLHDKRINRLLELGIKPIAGLVHHGSGPFFTDLYDPDFPLLLSEFAYRIASRYPFLDLYTPVNEPLTTARFSGLYGFWYPHLKDDKSFVRIFLNELKGIIMSMEAVQSVNPRAGLIQTEDLGKIAGTPELAYQVNFENYRKWSTYDFLLGKLDHTHPMFRYFAESGTSDNDFAFFLNNSIRPEICGFNYYVTSERYLDQALKKYPAGSHGGNAFERYADVEVVRANIPEQISLTGLLTEAWDKFHLPLALTEVHIGCTREEQLRWFNEAYNDGVQLRSKGIDFRAVTAWSFFGSFDWSSLLCRRNNEYESGVYDLRSGTPRPTALAHLIKSINSGEKKYSELLAVPGWWRRTDRRIYKNANEAALITGRSAEDFNGVSPLLIIGAGSLGKAFQRICESRGIVTRLAGRQDVDIASESSVKNFIDDVKPWAIINAAGFTRIDDAEKSAYACFRENTTGPVILSEACRSMGIRFVTFSTDQVFSGEKRKPYTENDNTNPLNLYGLSKRVAEEKVMKINSDALIIRSSFFFNPWNKNDILTGVLNAGMYSGRQFYLASDIVMSPAFIPDLVNNVLDLLIDGESGIWHLSSQDEVSYYEFARIALGIAGLEPDIITSIPYARLKLSAVRPTYSVLRSSGGITLPSLFDSLNTYINIYNESNKEFAELVIQPSL